LIAESGKMTTSLTGFYGYQTQRPKILGKTAAVSNLFKMDDTTPRKQMSPLNNIIRTGMKSVQEFS
jgi:hypothetical protein